MGDSTFDDVGTGADVIVLIHGHPFDRSMWRPQCDHFNALGWHVIAPDLRGYGTFRPAIGETAPAVSATRTRRLNVFADDIAELLDRLGIDRAVIAGLSMGGQIAMEFCRTRPERVRGLILAATFPQNETPAGRRSRQRMAGRLEREGMHRYAVEVLPKMLAPSSIERLPDVAQHVLTMMRNTDPAGAAAALRGRAERPSYEETLASLKIPSLIVVGSEDAFTTRQDAERMATLLSVSELVWLEGIGHMPNLEAADLFNAAVSRFLNSLDSPARP